MNYEIKNLPKSELEIEVTVPFSELEPHLKRAAVLISEEIKIEGFRPGKAPYDIVKNRTGEMTIYEKAADLAVRKNYAVIFAELTEKEENSGKEFTPVGRPEIVITKLAPGNELQYKIKIALLPEVELPDYQKIAADTVGKEKRAVETSAEEIENTLKWIQDSRAILIVKARPAEKGDLVEIDFEAVPNGAAAEYSKTQNHSLIIGKNDFLPGFDDQLVGMSAGEEKSFTIELPADWHEKTMAGKKFDFKVKMNAVQERKLSELNDNFAKNLGNFESMDALRKNIAEGITREKKEKEKQRTRALIIENISDAAKITVPDALVNAETDKMIEELKSGIEDARMDWNAYLAQIKKTPDELKNSWKEKGEKRARIALVLRKIARQEKIVPAEEEIKKMSDQMLARYRAGKNARRDIDPEGLKDYAKDILKNEKVFEFLEKL